MPSTFETNFAGPAAALMSQFGRPASYVPPQGSTITGINARLCREQGTTSHTAGVLSQHRQAMIKLLVTDVSNPATGGRINIEGEIWRIITTPNKRAGNWECACEFISTERQGEARVKRA